MIVILDTYVIVSALLAPSGNPAEIIKRWEADEFGVAVSNPLIDELENTLKYPRISKHLMWTQKTTNIFLSHYARSSTVVEPKVKIKLIEKDPDDNRVLECAIASGASYIVTGDKHLLELKEYQGIVILSPSVFVALLKAQEK